MLLTLLKTGVEEVGETHAVCKDRVRGAELTVAQLGFGCLLPKVESSTVKKKEKR